LPQQPIRLALDGDKLSKKTENYTNHGPVSSPSCNRLIANNYFKGQRQPHSCDCPGC